MHVRFCPQADKRADVLGRPLCATSGCEQSQQGAPSRVAVKRSRQVSVWGQLNAEILPRLHPQPVTNR
jgi:hypothetical protein